MKLHKALVLQLNDVFKLSQVSWVERNRKYKKISNNEYSNDSTSFGTSPLISYAQVSAEIHLTFLLSLYKHSNPELP